MDIFKDCGRFGIHVQMSCSGQTFWIEGTGYGFWDGECGATQRERSKTRLKGNSAAARSGSVQSKDPSIYASLEGDLQADSPR